MSSRIFLLSLLCAAVVPQIACRRIEVQIEDASAEGTAKGELLLHFTLDQEVIQLNGGIFGYLTVRGQAKPGIENATAPLQADGRVGERYRYLCQFPKKAERAGTYDYDGIGGERTHASVEVPYNLDRPENAELEFRIIGIGCGFGMPAVVGDPVTLAYRRP